MFFHKNSYNDKGSLNEPLFYSLNNKKIHPFEGVLDMNIIIYNIVIKV